MLERYQRLYFIYFKYHDENLFLNERHDEKGLVTKKKRNLLNIHYQKSLFEHDYRNYATHQRIRNFIRIKLQLKAVFKN